MLPADLRRLTEVDTGMVGLHSPAKINLFLRVLAKEESGFHQLETLFTALAFGDDLTLERADSGIILETEGLDMGPVEENLVYRAARGFLEESGVTAGVRVRIKKRIPLGGGLGGGSSNAGATLLGLHALFPGTLDDGGLLDLAGTLGSDVPFFLSSSPLALAWGRGTRVLPLPPLPPLPVLLSLPPVQLPTPAAYRLLSREREETPSPQSSKLYSLEELSSWERVGQLAGNDFETAVLREYPLLGRIRVALQETGPIISLLSGSGAALFAVFEAEAEARVAKLEMENRFPGTSFLLTNTLRRGSGAGPAGPLDQPGG